MAKSDQGNRMNILILVHVEETFRRYFPDSMYVKRLIRACKCQKYNRVVHCTSFVNDEHPIEEIRYLITEEIGWGWGYAPCMWAEDDPEREWLIESSGHEWTWIPPEFRDGLFNGYNVYLGGGLDGECLTDMECVLHRLSVPYKKVYGYTY